MISLVLYIDSSIVSELDKRDPTSEEEVFFANIAIACQKGYCYLCGDFNSIDILSRRLSGIEGKIYSSIREKHSEDGALLSLVPIVFIISFSNVLCNDTLPECLKSNPDKCRILPISLAQGLDINQCCLLGENLSDCKFYQFIAEFYIKYRRIEGIGISFDSIPGGGNTICDVLKNCVADKKMPTICIVDSDKKYGATKTYNKVKQGDTCIRACKMSEDLSKMQNLPPYTLHLLDIHEVENLIPLNILESMAESDSPDIKFGVIMLKRISSIDNGEPALFYDLKKGIPYISSDEDPKYLYWQDVLTRIGEKTAKIPRDKDTGNAIPTESRVFPPLSSNSLLERAYEHMNKLQTATGQILVEEYLLPYWESLGSMLFSWGCARPPLRS